MRLRIYRDEARSRRYDLIGGGGHPWSIDLVAITASGILVLGLTCALVARGSTRITRDANR
jgi:hypothetical protein